MVDGTEIDIRKVVDCPKIKSVIIRMWTKGDTEEETARNMREAEGRLISMDKYNRFRLGEKIDMTFGII